MIHCRMREIQYIRQYRVNERQRNKTNSNRKEMSVWSIVRSDSERMEGAIKLKSLDNSKNGKGEGGSYANAMSGNFAHAIRLTQVQLSQNAAISLRMRYRRMS